MVTVRNSSSGSGKSSPSSSGLAGGHASRLRQTKLVPVEVDEITAPFYVRYDEYGAGTWADAHSHRLGHLNYTPHGTISMDTAQARFVSPPQYGIWIPPGVEHNCYLQRAAVYRAFYVQPELCDSLPQHTCLLQISPVVKAILADFNQRGVEIPATPEDLRMAEVLLDQMRGCEVQGSYLPDAQSPALQQILDALQQEPGHRASVADWAERVHMTERTLARHCQQELGMSLGEWRQRMRYLRAVDALEHGQSVQAIALDLGFSAPSAFIAMFQREAGVSPDQFRREFLLE